MKTTILLALGLMTSFAFASSPVINTHLSVDGGDYLFPSEIECLESKPLATDIECFENSPNLICRTSFNAILKNGGSKEVSIYSSGNLPKDSNLWECLSFGLTDKLNLVMFKSDLKLEIKNRAKQIKEIKSCN